MLVGDELEFAISQYLDGQLSAGDVEVLEERLATDAEARQVLAAYQQLNDKLRTAFVVPAIDFEAQAAEISAGCAPVLAVRSADVLSVSDGWKIGPSSVAGRLMRWTRPLALAASVAIAISGVALISTHSRNKTASPIVAHVVGPQVEQSVGPVVAQVSIGAAPSVAVASFRGEEDVIDRPSIVLIDRADKAPDSDGLY